MSNNNIFDQIEGQSPDYPDSLKERSSNHVTSKPTFSKMGTSGPRETSSNLRLESAQQSIEQVQEARLTT